MLHRSPFHDALRVAREVLVACEADASLARSFDRFVELACATLSRGGRLYVCGNGGSMSDAMHFAEELVGRFRETRSPLPALAFSDPATLTCIANDFGFEEVFARQVEAHGQPGDLLLCLSTSGESANVVRAARAAREREIATVALLGRDGGKLAARVDLALVVPHAVTPDRIQEIHLLLLHAAIEGIEAGLGAEGDGGGLSERTDTSVR